MATSQTSIRSHEDMLIFQQLAAVNLARGSSATFAAAPPSEPVARGAQLRRRAALASAAPRTAQVLLVEDADGVLHWEYEPAGTTAAGLRGPGLAAARRAVLRNRYRGGLFGTRIVASAEAADVGPNRITDALQKLDLQLTPDQGLRMLQGRTLHKPGDVPVRLAGASRVLLLVHGTFSCGDMYARELAAPEFAQGQKFIDDLPSRYSHVVSFDHPTLSVSPMLNAIDLENALGAAGLAEATPVDVVCHSRGGLVTTWWLLNTRFKAERVVAVAAPLAGTSLASPYRVRLLLDYLANYAKFLSRGLKTAATVPTFASGFLAGAGGLVGVLGSVTSAVASLPIADAGIALVPGLHAMSRVTNNAEIHRLWDADGFSRAAANVRFHVIGADYEPADNSPWWNLWAKFKQLPWNAADAVTDKLFPGDNDLVVDTDSMRANLGAPAAHVHIFAKKEGVHHCAYFGQAVAVTKLRSWLQV